jgi:hypothetical protein
VTVVLFDTPVQFDSWNSSRCRLQKLECIEGKHVLPNAVLTCLPDVFVLSWMQHGCILYRMFGERMLHRTRPAADI